MGNYIIHTIYSSVHPETQYRNNFIQNAKNKSALICLDCPHNKEGFCLKSNKWCRLVNDICRAKGQGSITPIKKNKNKHKKLKKNFS